MAVCLWLAVDLMNGSRVDLFSLNFTWLLVELDHSRPTVRQTRPSLMDRVHLRSQIDVRAARVSVVSVILLVMTWSS